MRVWLDNLLFLTLLLILVQLGACVHANRRTAPLDDGFSRVTQEELFEIGLFQAGRGDLLRAEQYLTAARDRGYSKTATTYWLVRVCISAGRYQSALQHAEQYLRVDPFDLRVRLVVASIQEALGEVSLAQGELERIVQAEPGWALPHYRLALLYQRTPAQASLAPEELQEYLRLEPDGPHSAQARASLEAGSDPVGR